SLAIKCERFVCFKEMKMAGHLNGTVTSVRHFQCYFLSSRVEFDLVWCSNDLPRTTAWQLGDRVTTRTDGLIDRDKFGPIRKEGIDHNTRHQVVHSGHNVVSGQERCSPRSQFCH